MCKYAKSNKRFSRQIYISNIRVTYKEAEEEKKKIKAQASEEASDGGSGGGYLHGALQRYGPRN